MSEAIRRRVWTEVRVEPGDDGFTIMLDTRQLRLPGGGVLTLRPRQLADAVAQEWSEAGGGAIGGTFGPEALPMTRLAGTMQERVIGNRPGMLATLLAAVDRDLLCYRATHPATLVARQQTEWQPWLDWCANRHGIRLVVTEGVMPVSQPPDVATGMGELLGRQSDAVLTALGILVPALGSLVLALALTSGGLAAPNATRLSLLDELDQLVRWGPDRETEARHRLLGQEVDDAARFLALSQEPEA